MAPLYDPYRNDNHNSTISKWLKLGFATSQDSAGYAVRIARIVAPSSKGLRPILSEKAPITGRQKKSDRPMTTVTRNASRSDRLRSAYPTVGVYRMAESREGTEWDRKG